MRCICVYFFPIVVDLVFISYLYVLAVRRKLVCARLYYVYVQKGELIYLTQHCT
jgi:hypothetical protein